MSLKNAVLEVWNFLNRINEPTSADVIFILGGSSLAPVEKAASLYQLGFAPKIGFISTGGTFGGQTVFGMPENEKYREVLVSCGVPDGNILSEGLTTNTLMEARAAIPFLAKNGVNPERVILVSRPFHQLRAYLTFLRQHPQVCYINCPGNEGFADDLETKKRLVQEIERLETYSTKGDIEVPHIPYNVLHAYGLIRASLAPVPA